MYIEHVHVHNVGMGIYLYIMPTLSIIQPTPIYA